MAGQVDKPGANLAAALSGCGAPLGADEGRAVLGLLLRLTELGVLVFDETAPAYNMGQSNCMEPSDDE